MKDRKRAALTALISKRSAWISTGEYAQRLVDEDKAYLCYCTPEELEMRRQEGPSARGEAPKYDQALRPFDGG